MTRRKRVCLPPGQYQGLPQPYEAHTHSETLSVPSLQPCFTCGPPGAWVPQAHAPHPYALQGAPMYTQAWAPPSAPAVVSPGWDLYVTPQPLQWATTAPSPPGWEHVYHGQAVPSYVSHGLQFSEVEYTPAPRYVTVLPSPHGSIPVVAPLPRERSPSPVLAPARSRPRSPPKLQRRLGPRSKQLPPPHLTWVEPVPLVGPTVPAGIVADGGSRDYSKESTSTEAITDSCSTAARAGATLVVAPVMDAEFAEAHCVTPHPDAASLSKVAFHADSGVGSASSCAHHEQASGAACAESNADLGLASGLALDSASATGRDPNCRTFNSSIANSQLAAPVKSSAKKRKAAAKIYCDESPGFENFTGDDAFNDDKRPARRNPWKHARYSAEENLFMKLARSRAIHMPWSLIPELTAEFYQVKQQRNPLSMQVHFSQNVRSRLDGVNQLDKNELVLFKVLFRHHLKKFYRSVSAELKASAKAVVDGSFLRAYTRFYIAASRRRMERALDTAKWRKKEALAMRHKQEANSQRKLRKDPVAKRGSRSGEEAPVKGLP